MPIQVNLPRDLPFRAPHLVDEMIQRDPTPMAEVKLTLAGAEQDVLEREVGRYIAARQNVGVRNACALLVDYTTMEVKAAVGSANYRDRAIQGQVDGLRMQRSPGSALKPFVYALAMDQGLIHPNTLLRDAPSSFNGYDPEDFDHHFAGPISAHDALIQSRNVPAVDLESRLPASQNLYALLRAAGIRRLQPEPHYGLSITLGSAEVSPEELAGLYATLANRGQFRPLRFESGEPAPHETELLSPEACWLTLDILKDAPRPGSVERSPRASRWLGKPAPPFPTAMPGPPASLTTMFSSSGSATSTGRPTRNSSAATPPLLYSSASSMTFARNGPCPNAPASTSRRTSTCAALISAPSPATWPCPTVRA
jgi:penicillin-binding protein 1C